MIYSQRLNETDFAAHGNRRFTIIANMNKDSRVMRYFRKY